MVRRVQVSKRSTGVRSLNLQATRKFYSTKDQGAAVVSERRIV